MRYIVYGIGAVGGTIAARLDEAGLEVIGIARGPHLEKVRADGLRLIDPDREYVANIAATSEPSEVDWRDDDVVILCMKTQDTDNALRTLAAVAPSTITIVCGQNAVENERLAARHFGRVIAMCVMLPATHLEPGLVVANAAPVSGILDVGLYPSGIDTTTEAVAADLRKANFSCEAHPQIMRAKYRKLLMNLSNALDAASGRDARTSKVALKAREEAEACFRAAGIEYASEQEDQTRRGTTLQMRRVEGQRRGGSSSWQSLARGTGSIEADYLNGEIVLLGRLHGVATPANEALRQIANELAASGAEPGSVPIDEVEQRVAALEAQE